MTAEAEDADDGMEPIAVSLLTGFLGSGKTTLLNRLLKRPDMAETAVLINEFGEIGLDHVLVESFDEATVLVNAGCLCCTVQGELAASLRDLYLRRARGEVPRFRRVVIESTGLADPAPIIHTLMSDPVIRTRYLLDSVVTTVDAAHGLGQLDSHPEALKQAAVADRLVLTKTDVADPAAVAALTARLARLNPGAPVIRAAMGDIAPDRLFGAGLYDPLTKTEDVARWLRDEAYPQHHHHLGHDHDHGDHHDQAPADVNRHDERIRAHCLRVTRPFDWVVLTVWIQRLIETHGDRLLRIKGIVFLEGEDAPLAIHGVQHMFHDPARLPPPVDGDRTSRLVFITRDLDPAIVEASLAALERQAAGLDA